MCHEVEVCNDLKRYNKGTSANWGRGHVKEEKAVPKEVMFEDPVIIKEPREGGLAQVRATACECYQCTWSSHPP